MSRAKEKPGVMVYFDDIRPAMRMLDDERFGKLLRAVIDYSQMGVVPDLDDMGNLAFEMLRPKLDRDGEKYEEKRFHGQYMAYCRQLQEEGRERFKLSETEWKKQLLATDSNCTLPTTTETVTSTEKEIASAMSLGIGKGMAGGLWGTARENPTLSPDEFEEKRRRALEKLT